MSTQRTALFQAILARLSFGAVPVDGIYWFDPRRPAGPRTRARVPEVPATDWSPVGISMASRFSGAQAKSQQESTK